MAVPWLLITIVLGFAYGALKPGRQPKARLFWQGILIGLLLSAVLVVLDIFLHVPIILKLAGIALIVGIMVTAFVFSLFFVIGVFLGDLVTGSLRRATT
ncbi:MAG TPA: hypothetical protein VM286_03025 [Candidatus Thermoplasmatota archaeon]|nr:hypothetical protein [Candidatus Thermoplasmatota archaeon]